MKIKSLLLGSAAALVAVSGARAADAVVIPEPEAVEYVRVCDAAGAGYFYIPGGETCLKISGYVQYEMTLDNDDDGSDLVVGFVPGGIGLIPAADRNTFEKNYEARLLVEAWRATDYGDLATVIRMTAANNALGNSQAGNGPTGLTVDRAYFDLAGLRMGLDISVWDSIGFGGPADAYNVGGPVSGTVRYTANFGAGSFTLSLEEDSFADDFVPSVLATASFSAGAFSANVGVVYEDDSTEIGNSAVAFLNGIGALPGFVDDFGSAWGVKANARYDFGSGSIGAGVQYSSNPLHRFVGVSSYMAAYDWVFGADVAFDATDALSLGLGFQYAIGGYEAIGPGGAVAINGTPVGINAAGTDWERDDDWTIGASASYDITETLNTNIRVRYNSDDYFGARIRFRSSF